MSIDAGAGATERHIVRTLADLVERIGTSTVAALAKESEAATVAAWLAGGEIPCEHLLRLVHELTGIVGDREPGSAAVWLTSRSRTLAGESPLTLLRRRTPREVRRTLLAAARRHALENG